MHRDVILGLQSIGDGYPVRLEYKHTIRKAFIVYGELARTDMFPLSLTDGDILGITFVKENNTVAITTNGTMLGKYLFFFLSAAWIIQRNNTLPPF